MPKDREELLKLTVAVLRDLARKQLGAGTSKLRTKAQLVEALSRGRIDAVWPAASDSSPARAAGKKAPPKETAPKETAPKETAPKETAPKPRPSPKSPSRSASKAGLATLSAAAPDVPHKAPVPEPLQALPLDAQTLFVRWKPVPVRGKGERWELQVTSDGQPARTIQVTPQSRQAYVKALAPGPVYRAQLVARDSAGRGRVIGSLSLPVVFFPQPEPLRSSERFVHYSWSDPLSGVTGAAEPAPGRPLLGMSELVALGLEPALQSGWATSPAGPAVDSVPGSPLGWLLSSQPTSFAN
jgi:hypothetical protein